MRFDEFEQFAAAVGLIASDADRADLVRLYQMVDLDNKGEISLEELLQHYRAKYNPIDL